MARGTSRATGPGVRVEPATLVTVRAVVSSSWGRSLVRRFWCAWDISGPDALGRYGRFLMPAEPGRPAWVVQWGESAVGLLNWW
jgi:hypothetical protein